MAAGLVVAAIRESPRDAASTTRLLAELDLSKQEMEIVRPALLELARGTLVGDRPALRFVGSSTEGETDAILLAMMVEANPSARRGLAYALARRQEIRESRMLGEVSSGKGKPLEWRSKSRSIPR